MPEAPARFSTAIAWPRMRLATVHSARIDWSAVPPAGQGQMKVMGRSGQVWASRRVEVPSVAAPRAPSTKLRRLLRGGIIACLLSLFELPAPIVQNCSMTIQ